MKALPINLFVEPEFFAFKAMLSPTPPERIPVWAISYPLGNPCKEDPQIPGYKILSILFCDP